MDYLGLFSLGAFVGTIASLGVRYINSVDQWQKVLAAVLPAVLSGVALGFVDRFRYSPALGCYPLGLVAALLWTYADVGAENFAKGANRSTRVVGGLHLAASSLITAVSVTLVLVPAVLHLKAEYATPLASRVAMLEKEREKSLTGPAEEPATTKETAKEPETAAEPTPKA